MPETQTIKERQTKTPLPVREFVVGIYREKEGIVVRKFELIGSIRIPLDEQYALNIEDAIIIQNILIHQLHNHNLN